MGTMKTNNAGLKALTVESEQAEIAVIGSFPIGPIKLRRTINQKDGKGGWLHLWRIVGPVGHPYMESEISLRHVHANGSVEYLRSWEERKLWPTNPKLKGITKNG